MEVTATRTHDTKPFYATHLFLTSLRTTLAGFQSIRAGMQVVMHDITALLAMARRQPESATF